MGSRLTAEMYASMFPTAGTASIAPAAREEVTKAVEAAVIQSSFSMLNPRHRASEQSS
jgi:hypothetical protein